MEIVSVIAQAAQPIMDYTVAPVARQVGYLLFYNTNFKNLEDQVAKLKGVKDTINREVTEQRRNGRQINDGVHSWLKTLDEIVEAAEKLSDDPRRRNAGCCKGPFTPNLKSRHQLSRRAKKLATSFAEVMQGKQSIYPLAFLPNLEGVGSTSATSSEKLESRKKLKEDIVLALRDPDLSRIGVYGLGGVGKTTLVEEISKQVKDDKLFDEVVTANISQAADLERIQGEIVDLLGLHFIETSVAGRARRLRQRIKSERSILVILDDIWSILELENLGIPLKDHKGCKLLLTSRNQEILQKMETQKDFLVDVLKEEEAWSLFEDMVGDVIKDSHSSLRDVAKQVAQKCAGLIVLVVTVARALKNQDKIDSWKDALNQLETVDKEGMSGIIYSALELSYNHLKGDDVKALFLLCGLHGQQISVEDLLKYSMGLGIFKQIHTQKDARLKLHRSIDLLKASCLLIESNSNRFVKMHDIIHEVALSIASRDQHVCKIGRGNELWPKEEFLQRCTQINIEGCRICELPGRLECPNIDFFHLHNENESLSVPDSFFEGMKNLKVLHLTCMHLPSLPQSFHSLVDLQTICLDQCVLEDMTNIGALMNLQILSLSGSSMIRLPSELGQLTHLRMLDLSKSGIEIFPSNIISKLTNLEELHMGNASIKWDQEDSIEENENASLTELRHLTNLSALEIQINGAWLLSRNIMFNKLERYKIVIGDVWEWSDNYGASKTLKLKIGTVIHLEHGIKELIKGVEVLYLDEVKGISNVLYDLNGEGFPLIRHLHIQNNGKIQHIINTMQREPSNVFFPRLETLVLQNLNNLEEICHGSFANSSFAKLTSIKVKCCDQLKYLFSAPMVKALSQLIEIEVSECSSMKMIVSIEYTFQNSVTVDDDIEICSLRSLTLRSLPAIEDFYSGLSTSSTTNKQSSSSHTHVPSSFFDAKVKFFNLETLKLSSIHLENIWQDDQLSVGNSFHKLAKLCVKECSRLKYLFSCSMVGSFPNLKELEIEECEMMEEIIGTEGRNGSVLEEVGLPKLESVIISNMKKLKKVWHSQFDGLKTMEVSSCGRLENIFAFDAMHTTFGRMETLKVKDCGSVKEIFQLPAIEEDTITQVTQLKKLQLLDLPKLKQIWSKDPQGAFRFHNLQDVLVENCENLEYLFPFSIAMDLRQLENLTVKFCGMNEIVAKKEGPMDENPIFHFDRLEYMWMWDMHQLDRFYGGSHSLSCPLLRVLRVSYCPKLKLLGRQSTSHHHRKSSDHHNSHFSSQQPLFIIEEVIPKLEDWTLNNKEAIMVLQDPQWKDHYFSQLKRLRLSEFEDEAAATFLDSIVQKAPNLKFLVVRHSSLEEIFRDKRVADEEGKNKINTQLEFLGLAYLGLQRICREGFKIDPILEVLQDLRVKLCDNLKTLVPPSVTFSHLTYLEIEKCNGLINLIYSSTATSLVNLKAIKLKECNSIEEIVTHGMNETRDVIAFKSLRNLSLENLPRLKSFSSSQCFFRFPLLDKVVVSECPRMRTFCERSTSTAMLRKVVIKEGKDEQWCWVGDLNRTIKKVHEITLYNSEHLNFSWYPELRDSWSRLVENKMFCNLKSLIVEQCDFLSDVLIPSNLLRALDNLKEIQVKDCNSLEAVLELATANEEAISKNEASRLREIHLSNLPKLQYLWKPSRGGKREEDQLQIQRQQPQAIIAKVLLPDLETIIIKELPKLKTIWHPFFTSNSISSSLKAMEVSKCEKLDNIFPSYMERAFICLETLMVSDCNSVQVIFEFSSQMGNAEDTSRLQKLTLLRLSKLKQIWSKDPRGAFRFHNLQDVLVKSCENLEYLFPFSIAMDLRQLENLEVKLCGMNEIVAKKEGPMDENPIFHFDRLDYLLMWELHQLDRFYGGSHSLSCPMLRVLWVFDCPKLKFLVRQSTSHHHKKSSDHKNSHLSSQPPLFIIEEVIPKLEEWTLNNEEAIMVLQDPQWEDHYFGKLKLLRLSNFEDKVAATFLDSIVQKAPNLESLVVEYSSFLEEIFRDKKVAEKEGKNKFNTLFKFLSLHNLGWQHICREGFKMDPILEVLEDLTVTCCDNLKTLVPSSVTFSHLTNLEVENCNGLINLIYSSTATSLVNLKAIKLKECNSLEEIVTHGTNETEDGIAFRNLRSLALVNLPRLKSFSSSQCFFRFPLLNEVVVSECPRMRTFCERATSTTMLRKVVIKEGQDEEWCWEGDLNGTIKKIHEITLYNSERLNFSWYPELRDSWSRLVENKVFCKLKSLVVEQCDFLSDVLIPSNLLPAFENLEEIQVKDCDSLEVVFEFATAKEEAISKKEACRLREIHLSNLPKLQYIWKPSFGGQREEDQLQIQHQHQEPQSFIAKVLFPNLETIIIKQLPKLNTIWHQFFTSNSISSNLKNLQVSKCQKLDNIFPSYMERAFIGLETLMVRDCNSVQVIFEFSSQMGNAEDTTQLQKLTLRRLSKLKQIWSRDPQENLRFHKLLHVRVENCNNLEYLFPLSIAMHAVHLADIKIKNAERMKQIVSAEEGILDDPVKFEFNHLTSLVLWNLEEMEGFFAGNHNLLCPLLRELDIRACAKVKLFKTQCWSSQGRVSMQQPLFTLEEVIGKLEKLALDSEHADIILQRQLSSEDFVKLKFICLTDLRDDHAGLPYWFLQKLTGLEALVVENGYFKEVFHEVILANEEGQFEIRSRIKRLKLSYLPELHHICKEGFQMNPIIEALEKLWVEYCPNMKHLEPSSVTFCQLTYLEVQNCNGLIDLVTSSTARSLVRLTTLKIRDCNSLTQVVAMEREEADDQINFKSLENLKLQRLPKIKCFCSSKCLLNFPLLENVVVKQCPRMNNFTMGGARTPKLSEIRSNEEDEQLHWDGDLNRTINKMFVDMVAFHSFNHLEFSEYPELKELWYGQVGQKIFCNLKHMVVRKCAFVSTMIFSSNLLHVLHTLEVLEVAECDSLEAIFDVKALDDKAMESKEVSGLKKLTLSGLPNLKHIWNKEAEEIISFGNLQILEVEECQHLKNLFSVSLCQDLRQLEQLRIESCGVEEIVSVEEGLEKLKFDFPQLTSLELLNLTQLTNFYPRRYTLECPSLEMLDVRGCEELQVFAFDHLDSQPLGREDDTELQTQKALFHIEKVSQNLEDMSLNENDTMKILNGKCDKKLFQSIKILRLQHFQKTPINFLNDLIQKFPATTTLELRHSSFETLFPQKEIGHYSIESSTQIKNLWLFQLDQLEHIWKDDDLASHTLIQNLEDLFILECSGIITLVPTSASFKSLTSLAVKDCNRLMFFMTSCTAKSLVHLKSLTISNCGMLEEVVMTDEGESEEEITFESLQYLKLTGLSSFKSFCSAKHTFIFLSLERLKVKGCPKMQNFSSEVIIAPFLKSVEVENGKQRWKEDLNTTIKQLFIDKVIGKSIDGDYKESSSIHEQSSQTHQKRLSTSRALSSLDEAESHAEEIVDSRKQEMHKLPIPHTGIGTQKICEIVETPPNQVGQNTSSLTKVDAALGTQDETIERPLVQAFHQATGIHAAPGGIEIPCVQVTQNTSDITIAQNREDAKASMTADSKETGSTQETYESKRSFSIRDAQNASNPVMMYDTASKVTSSTTTPVENVVLAIGTQEIHAVMDKPLIQTDQDAEKLATAQNTEESHDSFIKSQKISDTIEKPTIPATQNVPNSTMINEAALDPSASQAQEHMILSVQESNIYRNYKGMVDIPEQNMPYLEAGLKRHPQVLDWLNAKRPRVLTSSFFSLFSEVTRILRTTRRVNLTEDYRNCIKECCAALQGVGFDESWISYVHGCIEECAGDEEDLERKVEETEAQIESMKKELASLEESLVLLRHKASRLHDFIES